jgi:hypothetical protein
MSTLSLRLPDSLHEGVRKLAKQDNLSINQFVTTAVAEKISALATESYLEDRAKHGSKKKFEKVLAKVKSAKPDEQDAL